MLDAAGALARSRLLAAFTLRAARRCEYLERRGTPIVTAHADTRASTLTSELEAILEARGRAVVVTSPSADGPSPLPVMSEAVAEIVSGPREVGLVLVGGDTARSVLDAAQVRAISAAGVVTPGVPVLLLTLPLGRRQIITKAGGFGDPSLLHRCIQALTEGVS